MNEHNIKDHAIDFARKNKKDIAKKITDIEIYKPEHLPISAFMAGSPGAGKTEYSKNIVDLLEKSKERKVIRIDGDEIRQLLPGYTGENSYLFQNAISIIIDKIHDTALENRQTFLLDGTFSNYDKAKFNIERSLKRSRDVFIFYVYQKPEVAWNFTKARETVEGRNIPKDAFINQFIESRNTINRLRRDFDSSKVVIFLVKKNFETHEVENIIKIKSEGPQIEYYLGMSYTKEDLEKLLC